LIGVLLLPNYEISSVLYERLHLLVTAIVISRITLSVDSEIIVNLDTLFDENLPRDTNYQ
jgi:hypothetical protein